MEYTIDSAHEFWLLTAGLDTYARSPNHARLDTPWNAFTPDRTRLVCSIWTDGIVDVIDPSTGNERRFVRLGGKRKSWKGQSVKHGQESRKSLDAALANPAITVVGYEALASQAQLAKGLRQVEVFYPERAHRLKPWIGMRGDDLKSNLGLDALFSPGAQPADNDVTDEGHLFELSPLLSFEAFPETATEDQLLEVGFSEDELHAIVMRQVEAEQRKDRAERASRLATIAAYTRLRANGSCEVCAEPGFPTDRIHPYLESHHIVPLAKLGEDHPDNTAGLCPGCHREAHYGKEARQREIRNTLLRLRSVIAVVASAFRPPRL